MVTPSRASALLLVFSLLGCGASEGGHATGDTQSEDALEGGLELLPGVAAIQVEEVNSNQPASASLKFSVGADAKVKKILRSIKKRAPNESESSCGDAWSLKLSFFDAKGKKLAHGSSRCGEGSIKPEGAQSIAVDVNHTAVKDVTAAPLVSADVLWGITKISMSWQGKSGAGFTIPQDIATVLDAMNAEQDIDLGDGPGCATKRLLRFFRGANEVATVTYGCTARTTSNEAARFDALGVDPRRGGGGLKIDGRAIDRRHGVYHSRE